MIYLHYSGYSLHTKIPFSVSGENMIILAQNVIIGLLLWKFDRDITLKEKLIVGSFFLGYAFLLLSDRFLSDAAWSVVAKSNIILCKQK